jgi:hypothetical protein
VKGRQTVSSQQAGIRNRRESSADFLNLCEAWYGIDVSGAMKPYAPDMTGGFCGEFRESRVGNYGQIPPLYLVGETSAGRLCCGCLPRSVGWDWRFEGQKMAGNQWVKRAQLGDSRCGFRSVQYAANVLLADVFWGMLSKKLVLCQSLKLGFTDLELGFTVMNLGFTVIPAQAGIQIAALDSRLRGNDVTPKTKV